MAFCKGTICQVAVLRQHIWSTLDRMHARRGVTPVKFFLALFFSIALLSFLFPDIFPNLSLGDERFFSGGRSNGPGDPERSAGSWTPQLDHTEGRTNHTRTLGGLLKTDFSGQHPLLELVAEAERKWNATAKRQSKTLPQAINEYHRRYNRPPPAGFTEWYAFATSHNFLLIDEFDQINNDIRGLLALPRDVLHERLAQAKAFSQEAGLQINVSPQNANAINGSGPGFEQARAYSLTSLLMGIARYLPDVEFYVNNQDASARLLSPEMRVALLNISRELSESELGQMEMVQGNDIFAACVSSPPQGVNNRTLVTQIGAGEHNFIYNPTTAGDFCHHPSLVHLHGTFSIEQHPRNPHINPEFVWAKPTFGGEIRLPSLQNYHPFTLMPSRPWSEKTQEKLFWRGNVVGNYHRRTQDKPLGWQGGSQRTLAAFLFANDSVISHFPWISKNVSLLVTTPSGALHTQDYNRGDLNELYTDIGLFKPALQCHEEDGTCEEMDRQIPWKAEYGPGGPQRGMRKYILDLDGNGQSPEFQRLLGFGSVVLKSTIFQLWNSDWLMPYYHYIPIQQDYSDVYDVMSFFAGPPAEINGTLQIDKTRGHDDVAQRIAENAQRFVKETWRWEDMQVYLYRLLLEYARVISDDRSSMDVTVD